jgi:hypothetical protein
MSTENHMRLVCVLEAQHTRSLYLPTLDQSQDFGIPEILRDKMHTYSVMQVNTLGHGERVPHAFTHACA